ncbi:hypothetical protein STCU_06176 [Strigomonas culicis]|uniref:Uncharacterized protein n=1 Tax=Strigomonas culicis TaxID=28005 RepID=S9VTR7_9TRYP|nr:hypothetical protein STCU_06176 [Strigomonas culicis]|eukprot:EPY26595.1 hypothetical protein STCU_06176 [Strigomonas culicis]
MYAISLSLSYHVLVVFRFLHLFYSMNKAVQFANESERVRREELEAFRHEQTVRRWKVKSKRKASRVIYLSDYLLDSNLAERPTSATGGRKGNVLLSMGSQYEKAFKKKGGAHSGDNRRSEDPPTHAVERHGNSKKVHFKVKSPDSMVPLNHYARYTKLKRTILHTRESALRDMLRSGSDTPQKMQLWYLLLLSERMKHLYSRVDACMRQKRFAQARHLTRIIQNVRYHMKRVAAKEDFCLNEKQKAMVAPLQAAFYKSYGPTAPAEDGEWVGVDDEAEGETSGASFFAKFDPTLVELAQVVATRSAPPHNAVKVDQRSGRYPVLLSDEALRQFHEHCQYDDLDTTRDFCLSDPFPASGATASKGKPRAPLFVAPYTKNMVTDLLDDLAFTTLQRLYQEQKKLKEKQPLQFKSRQRYVVGLQETLKCLRAKQVRLVLLAADMEAFAPPQLGGGREDDASAGEALPPPADGQSSSDVGGGKAGPRRRFQSLSEAVHTIQQLCAEESAGEVPCVTCMSRQRLSYALFAKQSQISCVGIMHAEQNKEWVKALKLCAVAMLSAFQRHSDPV